MSRDRIKKLLGMTTANGCTEAEAMSAAARAADLMAKEGLRPGEIEMDQDDIATRQGWGAVRSSLWNAIANCTNTAPITRWSAGRQVMTYVGREPGPEVATYLHFVTQRAIDRELKLFRATTWYKRRRTRKAKAQATADFTIGMVGRLQQKLRQLFASTSSGPALLEARAELDARFPDASDVATKPVDQKYWEASMRGREAGDGVALSHGVAGTAAPLAIGGTK
jgi:hypothetical protein